MNYLTMNITELSRFCKRSGKFSEPQYTSRKTSNIFFHKFQDNADKKREWAKNLKIVKYITNI